MKVFLYERVSSEEQVKHGYSLDAQDEALREFCDRHNHIVLGVYRDEGISGRKPYTKRPAMVQLLQDVETIKPDIILFTKLDRWFRNIKEYYKVQDILDKNKVDWKAINEDYDTSTASGRLYVNIKLSIAQDEADRTSERIKDVQAHQVMQGKVLGGKVPIGYAINDSRLVFGDDIEITKAIVKRYLTYQTISDVRRYILDSYGRDYTHYSITQLLKNPILKGEYRGNTAFCEPLISAEDYDTIQSLLGRHQRQPQTHIYLFSGLVICPVCGKRMTGSYAKQFQYYRCRNCYPYHINESYIESYLLENVEKDFNVNVIMKPKKQENPQKYKDRLKRLNDIYLMGNISEDEYRHKSAELQKQIADLSKVVIPKAEVLTKGWKEVYEMLDPVHKRAFWHRLLSKIEIDGRDVGRLYFL